jgi:nucleoside-diphosphate-sugar epimerase
MKIVVIGCGWLGLPLASRLVEEGNIVIGTTTTISKVESLKAAGIDGYCFKDQLSEELKLTWQDCDWAIITIPPSKNLNYVSILKDILNALPSTCRLVYTSSIGVYKNVNASLDETAELDEEHVVTQAENLFRNDAQHQSTILRLGGLIGDNRNPVIYLAGRTELPSASSPVNLIHLEDVIEAILIVLKEHVLGEIYNVVSPEHPTRKEFYTRLASDRGLVIPEFAMDFTKGKLVDGSLISKKTSFVYLRSIY